ncbi:replication/maintenance protein RepL, partial [Selenomonas infelix]|uniref:replication/maintenance protein RepL n=1 Tax=Selenomonas infelix TaxID=135082 RepID=UPI002478D85A
KQMAVTRKKVKVVGTETYIKQDTGELREMQVIDIEERDANFHKLWLGHYFEQYRPYRKPENAPCFLDSRPSGQQ